MHKVYIPPDIESFQSSTYISNIVVSTQKVYSLMKNVDTTKACGHDGVGNKIIQLCCEGFCEFFTNFINLSFDLGKFPFQWKLGNVIPLFKKDDRQLKNNFVLFHYYPHFQKFVKRLYLHDITIFCWIWDFFISINQDLDQATQQ